MIGDRFADGLEAIVVIGDYILDTDEFYTAVKSRDGYPCLQRVREEQRHGGAGAVAEMVRGLGAVCRLVSDSDRYSSKQRIIADERVLCRIDRDCNGRPPTDLPPAALVLIADYNKGVITAELMDKIAKRYKGKEIIADVHPGRPPGFYHCATALKASWPIDLDQRVPVIRTNGWHGMVCQSGGEAWSVPAIGPHPAKDPCGAGDMVLATLGVARLGGMSWQDACQWASENAALVCQQWGAVPVASARDKP